MTVNFAAMAINEGFNPDRPQDFNWSKAEYHPTYAHWRDAQMGQHMKGYKGIAVIPDGATKVATYPPPEGVTYEIYNRREYMEITGQTSGISALHAAVVRGYNVIFLIGYDYYQTKDGLYGYSTGESKVCKWTDPTTLEKMDEFPDGSKWPVYESSLRGFGGLRRQMIEPMGVEVYNTNEESMLADFPYMSLDDALEYASVC